jgi:anti-anti-sigma factor
MAFESSLEIKGDVAIITMSGELDAASAPQLKANVEKAATTSPQRLVLDMKGLEFMASAGLRLIVFSKQKMGENVDLYIAGAPEMVIDTLEKAGFHHSVIIVDEYTY